MPDGKKANNEGGDEYASSRKENTGKKAAKTKILKLENSHNKLVVAQKVHRQKWKVIKRQQNGYKV